MEQFFKTVCVMMLAIVLVGMSAVAVVVAGAVVVSILTGLLFIVVTFVGVFLAAWAVGMPITIKRKGVMVGYYRWNKFHPFQPPVDETAK